MRNINQLKAGVIFSFISMGINFLVLLFYTPVMLNLLGQSEYGLYNLASSTTSYLGLLSFGFGSAYIRYYSHYKVCNDQIGIAKLNGIFILIYSIIGFIALFAGSLLVINVDIIFGKKLTFEELETAKVLMAIMVLSIAVSFPASVFSTYITANEEFVFLKLLQLIKAIITPFVMLPMLLLGWKSIGITVATTGLTIAIEAGNIVFCFRKLKMRFMFRDIDFNLIKKMTVFSSYIFLNMITEQINWNIDKFILGIYKGTVAVAVYGLAAQLNTYYLTLSTTISSVFIPRVNRMIAEKSGTHEITDLFTRIGRIQFIVLSLICSGFIFFGKPFISFWAGNEYSEAFYITLLLIVPVLFPLIQNIGIEIQKAKNMHQFRSWAYFFIAIANAILSIPLAKAYGGIGAAIGTAVSLIVGNGFIMNWYYHKKVGINILYFWQQILKLSIALIPPVAVGILFTTFFNLYNNVIEFMLCGLIYVLIFCLSMWFLGMNQSEKDLIYKPVAKALSKLGFIHQ